MDQAALDVLSSLRDAQTTAKVADRTVRLTPPRAPRSSRVALVRFHTPRVFYQWPRISTSRVSPPGVLSISYGHVGCLKARAFPPPV